VDENIRNKLLQIEECPQGVPQARLYDALVSAKFGQDNPEGDEILSHMARCEPCRGIAAYLGWTDPILSQDTIEKANALLARLRAVDQTTTAISKQETPAEDMPLPAVPGPAAHLAQAWRHRHTPLLEARQAVLRLKELFQATGEEARSAQFASEIRKWQAGLDALPSDVVREAEKFFAANLANWRGPVPLPADPMVQLAFVYYVGCFGPKLMSDSEPPLYLQDECILYDRSRLRFDVEPAQQNAPTSVKRQ
jgi:hypothetical protein